MLLLESGVVDLRPLITHEMGLEAINDAMELLTAGQACKIILRPKISLDTLGERAAEADETDANIRGAVLHR